MAKLKNILDKTILQSYLGEVMKFLKILLIIFGILVLSVGALLLYLSTALPNVGEAPEMQIEITPAKVERGDYLANHVALCMDCHSTRDWSKFSGPLVEGTLGKGGEVFDENLGFPGKFTSKNITPAGIGDWTDGELYRAITMGVSKDGKALFPIMPYHNYGKMSKSDIESIIAYIRTLKPIENDPGESKATFPMNFIINTIPKAPEHREVPAKSDIVKYGEYITTASGCYDCHTKQEKGQFVGEPFAGGMEFLMPTGDLLRAPNITPSNSGIGSWSQEQFYRKFKSYDPHNYVPETVNPGEFQTIMPWTMYSGMKDEDINSIYAYLQTVEPVENNIVKFEPAK